MTGMRVPSTVQVRVVCPMDLLVRAVRAVVPHTGPEKAGTGLERVRLVVDLEGMRLSVVTTDGVSAAVASVLLEEADVVGDGEPADTGLVEVVEVDLTVRAARMIGRVHDPRGAREDQGARAEVVVDEHCGTVSVTDVTGLWPGASVRVRSQPDWYSEEGLERQDAARMVMEACAEPLAGAATMLMPSDHMRQWAATAKELGGLPLRATTGGHLLIAQGDADSPMLFLGSTIAFGTAGTRADDRAYDGSGTGVLMGLLIDGAPVGAREGRRSDERALVADLSAWLHEQDNGGPDGGEAA
ncbi:hypothetical protein [Actinomyces howellii]|uniref:DNA polymerase III subunit beta n=1 Tax=Actinomyces howellii TaxID=52771 RepID=A0A3S4RAT5_9ACTO|nr:hypothetical protein [Actinomyces howellii]VEG28019.1 Uncharacterised protein [Actinomyces howellii]